MIATAAAALMTMAFKTAGARCYLLLVYIFAIIISIGHGDNLWGVHLPLHAGLGPLASAALRSALHTAEQDTYLLAARTSPLSLNYSIFGGRSALRDLPDTERHLIDLKLLYGDTCLADELAAHRACAVLLLLRGYTDAAHDVILGVTADNLDEAEYAATHRGQTNWTREHPLTDSADLIHRQFIASRQVSKEKEAIKGMKMPNTGLLVDRKR